MQADITYTRDTGEKLVNETFGPNNIRRRTSGMEERHRVDIANGREARDLALDKNGFVLVEHRSAVRDFFDVDELKRVYYPEVQKLIGELAGAQRVVVFDHTLRSGDEAEREAKLVREPVLSAHNDYTEWSGPQRVRDLLADEAEELLKRRFAKEWLFHFHRQQVKVIHSAVEDLPGEAVYDFIVSGLPINNFPVAHVRRIFQVYERLLKPGGTLTYFEYVFIRQLKIPFVNRRERRRLYRVGRVVGDYIRDYQVRRQKVLINVPPAIVRHLHLKPGEEGNGRKEERRKVLAGAS